MCKNPLSIWCPSLEMYKSLFISGYFSYLFLNIFLRSIYFLYISRESGRFFTAVQKGMCFFTAFVAKYVNFYGSIRNNVCSDLLKSVVLIMKSIHFSQFRIGNHHEGCSQSFFFRIQCYMFTLMNCT